MQNIMQGNKILIFVKCIVEINNAIAGLPPGQRTDPRAVQWAIGQVKANHIDEIIADKIAAQIEAKVPGERKTTPQGTYTERGGAAPVKRKKHIVMTEDDKTKAKRLNMTEKDYAKYVK